MSTRFQFAAASVLALALAAGLQLAARAYTSDFSSDDDEPGHAVSSLAIHDYLTRGFPRNPVAFAENDYIHYPKIAIGRWPPLYYAGEAGWMLVFGRTRGSMLAFNATLAAALWVALFWWVRREHGIAAGIVAAASLAAARFVESEVSQVAPNIALGLACFCAAAALGRYLETKRRRDAVVFAAFAVAAVAIHGRGAVLALLPFAVLLLGPFAWNRLRVLTLAACLAVILILPHFLGQAGTPKLRVIAGQAATFLYRMCTLTGWPIAALALIGALAVVRSKSRRALPIPALVLSAWVFHSLVVAWWGDRYLISSAPAVAALAGIGFRYSLDRLPGVAGRFAVIAIACAGILWAARSFERKPDLGYHRMSAGPGRIDLIAGSALDEGAFIAEMDLQDTSGRRFALRASKLLASETWMGDYFALRFSSTADVLACLDRARVERVIVERASRLAEVVQLLDALRRGPWRQSNPPGLPARAMAFERTSPLPPGEPSIQLDMHYSLRKTLELKP